MLNTICIGLESYFIQKQHLKPYFELAEDVFTLLYVIEIILRFRQKGWYFFNEAGVYQWNWFDLGAPLERQRAPTVWQLLREPRSRTGVAETTDQAGC